MNPLKIAQVAPLWENIPPPHYGGTERVVHYLTEGLVKKGHAVTLFACGTSTTSAKLVAVYPRPLHRDGVPWTNIMYPLLNITEAFDREREFDILHIHLNKSSDYLSLPLAVPVKQKVVFTLHFPYPTTQGRQDRHAVLQKYNFLNYISISNAQRRGGENLNWVGTVYNGIDTRRYTYFETRGDYLLWLGKFNPDKGTREAILASQKAGMKILIAGAVDTLEGDDLIYYKEQVQPLIDGRMVESIGELSDNEKIKLYGEAFAFLNPIQWNEPYGLVMAEAMATGCPVISYASGAAPEIIRDGVTGYLIQQSDGIDGMVRAIQKLQSLAEAEYTTMRKAARKHIEENFSVERMVEGYEKVYEQLLVRGS